MAGVVDVGAEAGAVGQDTAADAGARRARAPDRRVAGRTGTFVSRQRRRGRPGGSVAERRVARSVDQGAERTRRAGDGRRATARWPGRRRARRSRPTASPGGTVPGVHHAGPGGVGRRRPRSHPPPTATQNTSEMQDTEVKPPPGGRAVRRCGTSRRAGTTGVGTVVGTAEGGAVVGVVAGAAWWWSRAGRPATGAEQQAAPARPGSRTERRRPPVVLVPTLRRPPSAVRPPSPGAQGTGPPRCPWLRAVSRGRGPGRPSRCGAWGGSRCSWAASGAGRRPSRRSG